MNTMMSQKQNLTAFVSRNKVSALNFYFWLKRSPLFIKCATLVYVGVQTKLLLSHNYVLYMRISFVTLLEYGIS